MFHRRRRPGFSLSPGILLLLAHPVFGTTIGGADGLTVTVEPSGTYEVTVPATGWSFTGDVGASLFDLTTNTGVDQSGAYSEISFGWRSEIVRHAAIRAWTNHSAILFTATAAAAAPNTVSFPSFAQYPRNLYLLTYSGPFAQPQFGAPSSEGPSIFFDSARNTFILSPAANFMTASIAWGPNGELRSGIAPQIVALPEGFSIQTLLVVENGINRAFDTWGNALLAIQGKTPPPNDVDSTLNKVGYWTDNGSSYYYRPEPGLSYEDTLKAVKADFDRQGIGLGYMQLDSWFYPKGPAASWSDGAHGIYEYAAASDLFPQGLAAFQSVLGIPLVTHARWIDSTSPYRGIYQMSGNVVVDPRYWESTAAYLASSGVTTYEQDWLDADAQTEFNLADPDAFLNNMAAAMAQDNLTIQYCMASPRHLLQSSKYNNATTARVSYDGFTPARWTPFLYTSRLAASVGIWPFSDVFRSSESDNLLLATLSAGPIGIGDPIGGLNAQNLLHAVRPDGVIVKPDVPLMPIDSSYLTAAAAIDAPQISATYSDFGGLRTYYIVAYSVGSNRQASFRLSDLGIDHPVFLYDYFSKTGHVTRPEDLVAAPVLEKTRYWIAAPFGPSGIAVLGDTEQFVSMGKKRIPEISDDGTVELTVAFAEGEKSRTIKGYSLTRPAVSANQGGAVALGYDRTRHLFRIFVTPGAERTISVVIRGQRTADTASR